MYIQQSVDINTSAEDLWVLLTETEQVKRWTPELIDDIPDSPGPTRVGLTSRVQIKEGSRIVEYESEITAVEPHRFLEIELRGGSLGAGPMRVGYRLSNSRAGTTLDYSTAWQPHGLMLRVISPFITMVSRRKVDASLGRLKKLAEAGPSYL